MKKKIRWPAASGNVAVATFHYKSTGDLLMSPCSTARYKKFLDDGDAPVYAGRIVLNRFSGKFHVEWEHPITRIEGTDLKEVQQALHDCFIALRIGKTIPDVSDWEQVIWWCSGSLRLPSRYAVLRDSQGKIQRIAPWDDTLKVYRPLEHGTLTGPLEPYTEERWAQIVSDYDLCHTLHDVARNVDVSMTWTDKHRALLTELTQHLTSFHTAWEKCDAR